MKVNIEGWYASINYFFSSHPGIIKMHLSIDKNEFVWVLGTNISEWFCDGFVMILLWHFWKKCSTSLNQRERERERERVGDGLCVCLCVKERERGGGEG